MSMWYGDGEESCGEVEFGCGIFHRGDASPDRNSNLGTMVLGIKASLDPFY